MIFHTMRQVLKDCDGDSSGGLSKPLVRKLGLIIECRLEGRTDGWTDGRKEGEWDVGMNPRVRWGLVPGFTRYSSTEVHMSHVQVRGGAGPRLHAAGGRSPTTGR